MNYVFVCFGKRCVKRGAREVAETLKAEFEAGGVPAEVHRHTCFDLCKGSCNVMLKAGSERRIYTHYSPQNRPQSGGADNRGATQRSHLISL